MIPIVACVGLNGAGKSLCAVEQIIAPALREGRQILSNTPVFHGTADRLLPADERALHPLYVPLSSWKQLTSPEPHTTIFLDEMSSMFEARESGRMPVQILSRFQQLRKIDCQVVWTAPSWSRADKSIRQITGGVWWCTGHVPKRVQGSEWGQNRLFRWRFYNAVDFEEFSLASAQSDMKGSLRAGRSRWYWRPRHAAQHLYDTMAGVDLLDHLDEFGTCVECGGHRRRPACTCRSHGADLTV